MQRCPPVGRTRPGASRAFTLIEIVIAVAILVLILALAVPSLTGVFADRQLRKSLDGFNHLVREAQERSVTEHRAYLLVWGENAVFVQPEVFRQDEDKGAVATFELEKGSGLTLTLPAALSSKPPGQWIFWPTGTCEPAVVEYNGGAGTWLENFSPLTARGDLAKYAAR